MDTVDAEQFVNEHSVIVSVFPLIEAVTTPDWPAVTVQSLKTALLNVIDLYVIETAAELLLYPLSVHDVVVVEEQVASFSLRRESTGGNEEGGLRVVAE